MNLMPWYLAYGSIILLATSMNNWLSMWVTLELSSWLMMILSLPEGFMYDMIFKMYIMFSLSSVILIFLWLNSFGQESWLLCILAFKMGLPPLHWWIAWIMKHMEWHVMWWFTTFHKLIPMLISLLVVNSLLIFLWGIVSITWSSLMFWSSSSYFVILLYSSCIHSSWLWMTLYDPYAFFTYFSIYATVMYLIFMKLKSTLTWSYDLELTTFFVVLLGIPMSSVFFTKLITAGIFMNYMMILVWLMMFLNVLTIFPYTRMIWNMNLNSHKTELGMNQNMKLTSYVILLAQFTIWPMLI